MLTQPREHERSWTHSLRPACALSVVLLAGAAACQDSTAHDPGSTSVDLASPATGVQGVGLMARLGGLWSGAATQTPLGSFPLVNMDLRAVGARLLFGRVDLDAGNNLRFGLEIEEHDGPVLTFRNGGYFLNILRDSRTRLIETTEGTSWRFCSIDQTPGAGDRGCGYIDARFTFADETHLRLDVKVRGRQHLLWDAERKERRELPAPFPMDEAPQPGDAPFPDMPRLRFDVSWDGALASDADVWVILTQSDCNFLNPGALGCTVSRSLLKAAPAGSTSAQLLFDQIHSGTYKATAILDRNRTLKTRLFPDSGDSVSLPNQPVTVSPTKESTASARTGINIP